MTALIALIVIFVTAALLWDLVKIIAGDGLGHRPPPPSHYEDLEAGSPSWWVHVAH